MLVSLILAKKMENLEKKMLREISNDQMTPKKYDFRVYNDLYEKKTDNFNQDIDLDLDYDPESVPLAEY